jgi:endonuclease/exonuclease/phosphatase family metal-dependent hydrolase
MRVLALILLLLAAPVQAAELKFSTWNIGWATLRPPSELPRDVIRRSESDWRLLRAYAQRLDADVVALQEVDGPEIAARIFDPRSYAFFFAEEDDTQRTGFAVRRNLRVTRNGDLLGLDLRPDARFSLRRGADITIEAGGNRIRLLSIHLKAGCMEGSMDRSRECDDLTQQAMVLAGWIAQRRRENMPFLIMGDFNRRMRGPDDEFLARLNAPLARATENQSSPCFAGSRGGRPFIDHILAGGAARGWMLPDTLRVMVYAERDARDRVSDHCPVSVGFRLP